MAPNHRPTRKTPRVRTCNRPPILDGARSCSCDVYRLRASLWAEVARGVPSAWDRGLPEAPRLGAPFALAWILEALGPARTRREQRIRHRALEVWRAWARASGWTYDPLDPHLGEDADDLAMALRLQGARGLRPIPDEEDRIRALLGINHLAPGVYRTWLAHAKGEMEMLDRRSYASDRPDHDEVVANLLEALTHVDPIRHREEIRAGAGRLLLHRQGGLLASSWYPGWGYGTWRLLELTCRLARRDPEWARMHRQVSIEAASSFECLPREGGLWLAGPPPGVLVHHGDATRWSWSTTSLHETAWVLACLSHAPATRSVRELRREGRRALEVRLSSGLVYEPAWITDGPACHGALDLTRAIVWRALGRSDEGCRIAPPSRTMGRRSRKDDV